MIINVEDFMIYNMIIIVVSALFLFLAYRKGFMRQLFDVVSLIASYIVSGMLCGAVANIFPIYQISTPVSIINDISTSLINAIIWFVILIVVFRVVYWILCFLMRGTSKIKTLSFINHMLGLVLGAVKVLLILGLITILLRLPFIENGSLFVQSGVLSFVDELISYIW